MPIQKERKAAAELARRREAALQKQHELWPALAEFIRRKGGFLVSTPTERNLRIEVPQHSELPDELESLGYDLKPAGTNERIIAERIVPVLCFQFQIPLR